MKKYGWTGLLCLMLCGIPVSYTHLIPMKMDLRGKRAIVTGAGGGIGRSIALMLEGQGVHVMLCGRSEEKLKKTTRCV